MTEHLLKLLQLKQIIVPRAVNTQINIFNQEFIVLQHSQPAILDLLAFRFRDFRSGPSPFPGDFF